MNKRLSEDRGARAKRLAESRQRLFGVQPARWVEFVDPEKHTGSGRQLLPPLRRYVLCKFIGYWPGLPAVPLNEIGGVVVGYLKFAAGDRTCPYFVCSAMPGEFEVVAWCDCLGDSFRVPGWAAQEKTQ